MGGIYRPGLGGYGYDDDRYGGRDDDRNGYGREKEWGDDRYGRYGDHHSRDSDEHYGRDDDYRGRSRSVDGYGYSSRSRSSDRERDCGFEDDGQYSSRGSGARADDYSQDGSVSGKGLERKISEQNLNAPPSYEEAVGEARSSVHSERGGEILTTPAPIVPAPVSTSPCQTEASATPSSASPPPAVSVSLPASAPVNKETESFDEFDPRSSVAVAPTTSGNAEMDLLGSLSDSFSSNPLAVMPATLTTTVSEVDASANFSTGTTFAAAPSASQPFDDPFGDGPFRAIATTDAAPFQSQNIAPTSSFVASSELSQSTNPYGQVPSAMTSSFAPQDFPTSNQDAIDILADILPPCESSHPIPSQMSVPSQPVLMNGYSSQAGQHEMQKSFPPQTALQNNFVAQSGFPGQPGAVPGFDGQTNPEPQTGFAGPTPHPAQKTANYHGNYLQQQQQAEAAPQMGSQPSPVGPTLQYSNSNLLPQTSHGSFVSTAPSQSTVPASTALALVPQPAKDKFETKSTVWADTLSRGLVNLDISGPKTNPLSDIGVDFDAINRREKRMEKPTTSAVTSTITMGKAMGLGSGMGRAGAGALGPPPNSMVGPGMGMAVGGGGGYGGGVNRPPMSMNMGIGKGMGMNMGGQTMGMGMNMSSNIGTGMNTGMGPGGAPMQPMGFPPGANMPGGYNLMMGRGGGYIQQQPYGGGYR